MKINDMNMGKKITLNLMHNNQEYKVEVSVITKYGDGVLITPVTVDGELVDYCSNANFVYEEEYTGIKHRFKVDSLNRVDFSGTDFHVLCGREIKEDSNQRKAERYIVELPGRVQINGRAPKSVVIHDVSLRGMSLMVGNGCDFKTGDRVRVVFNKDKASSQIDLYGSVVRMFNIGNRAAAGVVLKNFSADYISFVMSTKAAKLKNSEVKIEKKKEAKTEEVKTAKVRLHSSIMSA